MRNYILFILMSLFFAGTSCTPSGKSPCPKPRIIITTDINEGHGDPDDKQSMAHMLMYADEMDLELIIPDYWSGDGYLATMHAIDAYEEDYSNISYAFREQGYPVPDSIRSKVAKDHEDALERFLEVAGREDDRPIYVLVWGSMNMVKHALMAAPEIAPKLRLLTIATNVMAQNPDAAQNAEVHRYCEKVNWNGRGRNEIFDDARFDSLWWIENDWAYNGMFEGREPADFLLEIKEFGNLGHYIWSEVQAYNWAHYFRAGDTPTLLYLLERCDHENPSESTWGGHFIQPYPNERPFYWIDDAGNETWNYTDPCESWELFPEVYTFRVNSLLESRPIVYEAYRKKMTLIYNKNVMD